MSPTQIQALPGKSSAMECLWVSDTLPPAAHMGPGTALDLRWVVLVCFLLNYLVGLGVGAEVSSEGQQGSMGWELVAQGA